MLNGFRKFAPILPYLTAFFRKCSIYRMVHTTHRTFNCQIFRHSSEHYTAIAEKFAAFAEMNLYRLHGRQFPMNSANSLAIFDSCK